MATAGFTIPKVNFISVSLDGGKDLFKLTNEPHVYDVADATGVTPSSALENSTAKMQVDILMSIEVGFDQSSCNLFSSFFQEDFTKYLKILLVQSTDAGVTENIVSDPSKYFDHSDFLLKALYQELGLNTDLVNHALISFSQFEGNALDLDNNPLTDDSTLIEKKYDSDGNIIYVFPYKVTFEVPESRGGIDVQNLSYFVQAYIDVEEIFIEEGMINAWVDLPQNVIKNLTSGEVNYLSVIQGGTTNFFGQTFYTTEFNAAGSAKPLSEIPNPVIWTGPVHYHGPQNPGPNGYVGYMAGTQDDMGVPLISQTVFNGIIQDYREIIEIDKIDFDYSLFSNSWFNQKTTENLQNNLDGIKQVAARDNAAIKDQQDIEKAIIKTLSNSGQPALFTSLHTGMDGSGNTRYLFGFNFREALKQNTAFPKLLDNVLDNGTDSEKENLLNKSLIKNFKIYRHKVYKDNVADPAVDLYEIEKNDIPKLVAVTKDSATGVLKTISRTNEDGQLLGTAREVNLKFAQTSDNLYKKTRFFTGTDVGTPNDGNYVFSVEITMNDPMIEWVAGKVTELENILYGTGGESIAGKGFLEYVNDAKSKPSYFNLYTNRFTQEGIDFLTNKYTGSFVYGKIFQFFQVLSTFTEFDENSFGLYNFLSSISSTNFGNPSGALKSLQVMESVYKKVSDLFNSISKYKKPIDSQHVESQYAAGSNPIRNFLITKTFSSKIEGSLDHLTGYDFLSLNNTSGEDSAEILGLKRLSRPSYDKRVELETKKLFTSQDYNVEIPKKPLAYSEAEDLGPTQIEQKQGPIMNPNDTVGFSKNAYLAPSLVNFRTGTNQPLLNNGNTRTDINNLNNIMLNIIRYNLQRGQKLDFPFSATGVATGQGDKVIKKGSSTESKFDLLSLMSGRQTTISAVEILKNTNSSKGTNTGIMGALGAPISNIAESELSLTNKDNSPGVDIYSSQIDPSMLLMTVTEQNLFKTLQDESWSWEYYVQNFDNTFFKEYLAYGILAAFGGGTGGVGQVPNQSPLTRAPNHLKSLMLNLDYTRDKTVSAFEELYQQVKDSKPYIFDVEEDAESSLQSGYLVNKDGQVTAAAGNKIMYQNPEFLSFFMLNFKLLTKVEVLMGYELDQYGNYNLNAPIWKLLTQDIYSECLQTSGNILCRLMPYQKDLYGIKSYEFMQLPFYNEHFIIDFSVQPVADLGGLTQGAQDQQGFDTSPFLEPDSQEFLPGGQTMEQAEALVGEEGGAMGISIATGISAGAVTELGMTGFIGGAAGGVAGGDVYGTGGGFGTGSGLLGGSGTGGTTGGGSGPLLMTMMNVGNNTGKGGIGSEAMQNSKTSGIASSGMSNTSGGGNQPTGGMALAGMSQMY